MRLHLSDTHYRGLHFKPRTHFRILRIIDGLGARTGADAEAGTRAGRGGGGGGLPRGVGGPASLTPVTFRQRWRRRPAVVLIDRLPTAEGRGRRLGGPSGTAAAAVVAVGRLMARRQQSTRPASQQTTVRPTHSSTPPEKQLQPNSLKLSNNRVVTQQKHANHIFIG